MIIAAAAVLDRTVNRPTAVDSLASQIREIKIDRNRSKEEKERKKGQKKRKQRKGSGKSVKHIIHCAFIKTRQDYDAMKI